MSKQKRRVGDADDAATHCKLADDEDLIVLVFARLSLRDARVCCVSRLWHDLYWATRFRVRFDDFSDKSRVFDQRLAWLGTKCLNVQCLDLTAAPFITDVGVALAVKYMPSCVCLRVALCRLFSCIVCSFACVSVCSRARARA